MYAENQGRKRKKIMGIRENKRRERVARILSQ
jgi:hypothetical protein